MRVVFSLTLSYWMRPRGRFSHETASMHDRLKYRLPVAGIVPTLRSVAHSLDLSRFVEASTLVRLICPASQDALQQVQLALFGLVNLCGGDIPPADEEITRAAMDVIRALQRFEEAIRKELSGAHRGPRGAP